MTTSITKIIDLKNFPITRTVFYLLQELDQRKARVKAEIKSWKEKFPSAVSVIEKYEKKTEKEFNEMDETVDKAVLNYFYSFNIENDILNLIKPETAQKIGNLLADKGETDPIIKLLKEIAREQQADLEGEAKSWKAGVIGLVFLLESVEKYYLVDLPSYIKGKLELVEPVALGDLDQEKLKANLGNIYSALYAGFRDTEAETNFKDFQETINAELGNIKTSIDEVRKTKEKPKENIEATKKELEETKARLKIYDDTFGYLYPLDQFPNGTQMISDWWDGLNAEWKKNFKDKYGTVYSESLKKVKKDLDDKDQQIKTLEKQRDSYKGYLAEIINSYKQEEEYVFEEEAPSETEKN